MYNRLHVYKGTYLWTFDILNMHKVNGKWERVRFLPTWRGGDYDSQQEALETGLYVLNTYLNRGW